MTDQIIMFISQLLNGLKVDSMYALVALDYIMVYGTIRLINPAHGDFIMVGACMLMLTISTIVAMRLPVWVAVIPAILVCMAVGVIVEKAVYRSMREKGNSMAALITAIAMSSLLENDSQAIFGADFQTVPTVLHLPSIAFGKLKLPGDTLLTIVIGLVIMVGLQLFTKFTRQGKVTRAVSEDKETTMLMGISVSSIIALTFATGSGLAVIASLTYHIVYSQVSPMMDATLGPKTFVVVMLDGIDSIPGTMVGGLAISLIKNLTKAHIGTITAGIIILALSDAIVFTTLIIVLLVKPSGIMGKNEEKKV